MYDLTLPSGDKFSFIAVDACVEPGPRRPYNFFGNLQKVFNVSIYIKLKIKSNLFYFSMT